MAVVDFKGLDICDEHKEEFKLYCVKEDKVCCSICAIEKHRRCEKVISLTKQAERKNVKIGDVLTDLSKLEISASKQIQLLQETMHSVGSELEPLLKEIEATKRKVVEEFDNLKLNVKDNIKQSREETTPNIRRRLDNTMALKEKIAKAKSVLMTVSKHGPRELEETASLLLKTQMDDYPSRLHDEIDGLSRPVFRLRQ